MFRQILLHLETDSHKVKGCGAGILSGKGKSAVLTLNYVSVPPVPVPGVEGPGAAMTTGDCCHLPGSLCDCPGSAALSKSVEDSDMGRPQYVTQVTAKDGRLLSTVIKALGAQR
ncbi:hypothetical protein AV530_012254 [Patagioenas fasciata monilis]|uniref:Uncharacterized protein n=1 Tax=Patagioenas fasciata monilis TaxID=372326 RepID=A0A1V4J7Y2_PATFA|nr:hypothetical protein AV530_012254 [Patagioenas fasciata monilis]